MVPDIKFAKNPGGCKSPNLFTSPSMKFFDSTVIAIEIEGE